MFQWIQYNLFLKNILWSSWHVCHSNLDDIVKVLEFHCIKCHLMSCFVNYFFSLIQKRWDLSEQPFQSRPFNTLYLNSRGSYKGICWQCPSSEGFLFDLTFLLPVAFTRFSAIVATTKLSIWKLYCNFLVYFNSLLKICVKCHIATMPTITMYVLCSKEKNHYFPK